MYLDAASPVADCSKTSGGSDVIHQQKGVGFVENLPCDAVKPAEENNKQRCNLSEFVAKERPINHDLVNGKTCRNLL